MTVTAVPAATATEFYECRGPDGSTTFQSEPCTGNSDTVRRGRLGDEEPERRPAAADGPGRRSTADDDPGADAHSGTGPRVAKPLPPYSGDEEITNFQLKQARLGNALGTLSRLKTSAVQYYMTRGAWPRSLSDMGFDPARMKSRDIKRVYLQPGGRIVADLVPFFGDDKKLALTPESIMDGTQLEWHCALNYPERFVVRLAMASCRSRSLSD